MDFDYKKYSLEQLSNWVDDSMTSGKASPQEIYDVILNAVRDNYYVYKKQVSEAYELLALLNGNDKTYEHSMPPWGHSDLEYLVHNKNDKSSNNQKNWNSFWEETYYPEEHQKYTEEEMNAMCDKAASDEEKNKCREYNLREAEYYNKRAEIDAKMGKNWKPVSAEGAPVYVSEDGDVFVHDYYNTKEDKVVKWQLPVQLDGLTGECYVELPDDLLERAKLKENDTVRWIDRGDGSFELRKVNEPLGMDEC